MGRMHRIPPEYWTTTGGQTTRGIAGCQPGPCVTCLAAESVNVLISHGTLKEGPYCNPCFDARYRAGAAAWQAERHAQLAALRARGMAYWQSRGIKVGQPMQYACPDMLTGGMLGVLKVRGVAKVGNSKTGAYVSAKPYGKAQKFAPDGWSPIQS